MLRALSGVGVGTADLIQTRDVLKNEITVFNDRVRIDVQTSTPSITFADVWDRRVTMTYESQEFYVLCRDDLIASKRASGRPCDMEDIRMLQPESSS